jgi:3-deoxy-manno-octulosonate cytidylyltransferase (CMP-KDO synthetase)
MNTTAVIPARYASSRFPGKPLALLHGKPMFWHVVQRCLEAKVFGRVIVATEDERIVKAVEATGFEARLTSPSCASGSDRVAEVMRGLPGSADDVFVNVQGDEPAIHPAALASLLQLFSDETVKMGTLVRPLLEEERSDAAVVKVVRDVDGAALYFSRHDIPYPREPIAGLKRWAHLGIYAYRRATLAFVSGLAPTALEEAESLEQLRALGHGVRIHCVETPHRTVAVDRPEDVPRAEAAITSLVG